jgi:hypothetical protein
MGRRLHDATTTNTQFLPFLFEKKWKQIKGNIPGEK